MFGDGLLFESGGWGGILISSVFFFLFPFSFFLGGRGAVVALGVLGFYFFF